MAEQKGRFVDEVARRPFKDNLTHLRFQEIRAKVEAQQKDTRDAGDAERRFHAQAHAGR